MSKPTTKHAKDAYQAYVKSRELPPIERKQSYTVTDLIVETLQWASKQKWFDRDYEEILNSAKNHLDAETVESCPKCGDRVIRENAFVDYGTGDEDGRTFYYCSQDCLGSH